MNWIRRNVLTISLATLFVLLTVSAESRPFYVVVGTFSEEVRAGHFASALRSLYPDASVIYDNERDWFYVHVMETDEQHMAEGFRRSLRENVGFADAWVYANFYSGKGLRDESVASRNAARLELFNGGSILLSSSDNSYLSISKYQGHGKAEDAGASEMKIVFHAKTATGTPLAAKISFRDLRGTEISAFRSGEVIALGGRQLAHTLRVVCHAAGYHAEVKEIDLTNFSQLSDTCRDDKGVWEVHLQMTKAKADVVSFMYHDLFYPDAAVLHPDSRKKIEVLRTLMQAKSSGRVVINSHCNPNSKLTILLPAKGHDPFDISDVLERSGSDKMLSKARAESLRDYLVRHGIDRKRVVVMGWGSLDPLVRHAAESASQNDRIEIVLTSW